MERHLILAAAVVAAAFSSLAERPSVDKTGLEKTAWVQLNPWFPIDMAPKYDLGGPNTPYRPYRGTNSWQEVLQTVAAYGIDGVLPEVNIPGGHPVVYRTLLDQAASVARPMRVGLFCGFYGKTPDESAAGAVRVFRPFREDFKANPHVARAGTRPIVLIYNPLQYGPDDWQRIFEAMERELGPMCFLMSYSQLTAYVGPEKLEAKLREYLPSFDGVSAYNFSMDGIQVQRKEVEIVTRVMRDFPHKLFEGGIFSTHTQHFNMAGLEVHLSRDWRESVRLWLAANPDAVEITNLFDHYENSLVYPCYEREDLLLRYLQYELCRWRGETFAACATPELVLCNQTSALIGWTRLDYEVLGFPLAAPEKEVRVSVELCTTGGDVLKTLGPEKMTLDAFREVQFSVPSTELKDERGVVPRLVYEWKGETHRLAHSPMTLLSPSLRPNRMYWARSTRNAARVEGSGKWAIDGIRAGGTRQPRRGGQGVVTADFRTRGDYLRHGIRRDGSEELFLSNANCQWQSQFALPFMPPGEALHWYNLEIQDQDGRTFTTLPIWEADGNRAAKVPMPILWEDGAVVPCDIEGARVPFFHWPCDRDDGQLVVDVSGYEHNARLDGSGYGGGHLGWTGYNHAHNGPVGIVKGWRSPFRTDADGRGYLQLKGEHYIVAMGGTAMPGASTYELSVRPQSRGRRMGLLCGTWGSVVLTLAPDGRLCVARRSDQRLFKTDTEIWSQQAIPTNVWTHVGVTYDLESMRLFVDGALQGVARVSPNRFDKSWGSEDMNYCSHEFNNELFIGAEDDRLKPVNLFDGDVREIRVYGRNLSPTEFLLHDS